MDDNCKDESKMARILQRFLNLIFGLNHVPHYFRKYLYCQCLAAVLILFLWIKLNGGFWPVFLASQSDLEDLPSMNLLDFFPSAQTDAAKVTWAHGVNSWDALTKALQSNVMMLEGDIMLKGQGTSTQELLPIMAHPPSVDSDLTFDMWVKTSMHSGKGLKLDFKSIDAVELSLQSLNQLKGQLHFPIWLNADILEGPNANPDSPPVDAARFLRLCTTTFPQSTLSLGWTTGEPKAYSENRYDWLMVKEMHDVIDKWDLKQALTFPVRASMVKQSIPMLRWLLEMTGGTLNIWAGKEDFPIEDLMALRRKLPVSKVYYDLPKALNLEFVALQEPPSDKSESVDNRQTDLTDGVFNHDRWTIVRSDSGQTLYMGTNAILIQRAFLVSKAKYELKAGQKFVIVGKLEFLPVLQEESDQPKEEGDVHIDIFLHVTQGNHPGAVSGFKITINKNGMLVITTQSVPGIDKTSSEETGQELTCLDFEIEEIPNASITVKVAQFCRPGMVISDRTWYEVKLNIKDLEVDGSQVAIRMNSVQGMAAVYNMTMKVQDLML